MRNTSVPSCVGMLTMLAMLGGSMASCQATRPVARDPVAITSVDQLDWLAGNWIQESADGRSINEELWLAPAGGMMLGLNRTIQDGVAVFFEYLMIREVDSRIAYLAMPGGQYPPTVFPLVDTSAGTTAIFENRDHDFPERIEYRRDGDRLTATLTGRRLETNTQPRVEQWMWRLAAE